MAPVRVFDLNLDEAQIRRIVEENLIGRRHIDRKDSDQNASFFIDRVRSEHQVGRITARVVDPDLSRMGLPVSGSREPIDNRRAGQCAYSQKNPGDQTLPACQELT